MIDAVKAITTRYNMLSKGDNLLIGLSGGADSVALLNVMLSLATELEISISACHVNHMLRGIESDCDEKFVRCLCAKLNVPLKCFSVDVNSLAQKQGKSTEEAARNARYECFEKASSGGKIATAHTLSDSAETVLLNLTRGTAIKGLCGIPPVRGNIIRPLIECTRSEVEDYCNANSLEYVTDSSNLTSDYTRNKLRHEVIPVFKGINPSFENAVLRMTNSLEQDSNYLDEVANAQLSTQISKLAAMPTAIRHRCISKFLEKNNISLSTFKIIETDAIIMQNSGKINVDGNSHIVAQNGELKFISSDDGHDKLWEVPLSLGECTLPNGDSYVFKLIKPEEYKEFINFSENSLYQLLDYDKIIGTVVLRSRYGGDKIKLNGRGFTSTVKKLLASRLPVDKRAQQLIIADDDGPVYVEGFGIAERVKLDNTTKQLLIWKKYLSGDNNA